MSKKPKSEKADVIEDAGGLSPSFKRTNLTREQGYGSGFEMCSALEKLCNKDTGNCNGQYENDCTHPLSNYLILTIVFGYLGVIDLKSCRLVNKHWSSVATPHLLSEGVISVDAVDAEELSLLENWMKSLQLIETHEPNPSTSKFNKFKEYKMFKNFVFDKITHNSYPDIKSIMGLHVESITVSHWWNDSRDLLLEDYEDLILNQCPNLKYLNIPATENFKRASKFLLSESQETKLEILIVSGHVKPAAGFWKIINMSPNLKSLKLDCQLQEEFWKPDPLRKTWNARLHNLKRLEVKSYGNESISIDSSVYFRGREWTLKSLDYECYILTDDVMRDCSHHLRKTLEELRIALFNKQYDPWPADKGKDWVIPPTLTKLKHVKLEIDDHCEGPIFCRTLVASVFIPSLVSLEMSIFDDEDCSEQDWPDGLFQEMLVGTVGSLQDIMNITPNTSLNVLKLPPKFQDITCVQYLASLYPNITEVEMKFPTAAVLVEIFTKWTEVQRLTLILSDDQICWSTMLTGLQFFPEDGGTFQLINPSVANLQKLTFLKITLTSEESQSENDFTKFPLNDWFIYYGLMSLPVLQRVFIKGHEFTTEAILSLRKNMLPFCSLDFVH